MAAGNLYIRQTGKSYPKQLTSSDQGIAPGTLTVASTTLSGNGESLRIGGDVQIDGLLRGPMTGGGLAVGKAGASSGTGSAMQVAGFSTTQIGYLTPASGMEVFNSTLGWRQGYNGTRWGDEALNNNFQATTNPAAGNDTTQGYSVGSLWVNTTAHTIWTCISAASGAAVWVSMGNFYEMAVGGRLDIPTLPFSGLGVEVSAAAQMLVVFQGRRGVAGSSGTTTVQLEVNGSPISGATLSWVAGTDAAFALKSVSISQAVALGDRLSIRLTSAETAGYDVFTEVN